MVLSLGPSDLKYSKPVVIKSDENDILNNVFDRLAEAPDNLETRYRFIDGVIASKSPILQLQWWPPCREMRHVIDLHFSDSLGQHMNMFRKNKTPGSEGPQLKDLTSLYKALVEFQAAQTGKFEEAIRVGKLALSDSGQGTVSMALLPRFQDAWSGDFCTQKALSKAFSRLPKQPSDLQLQFLLFWFLEPRIKAEDGQGYLDSAKFIELYLEFESLNAGLSIIKEKELRRLFFRLDVEGQGHIHTDDILKQFGETEKAMVSQQLRLLMEQFDDNQNGTIELEEFQAFYQGFIDLQYASVLFDDDGFRELWGETRNQEKDASLSNLDVEFLAAMMYSADGGRPSRIDGIERMNLVLMLTSLCKLTPPQVEKLRIVHNKANSTMEHDIVQFQEIVQIFQGFKLEKEEWDERHKESWPESPRSEPRPPPISIAAPKASLAAKLQNALGQVQLLKLPPPVSLEPKQSKMAEIFVQALRKKETTPAGGDQPIKSENASTFIDRVRYLGTRRRRQSLIFKEKRTTYFYNAVMKPRHQRTTGDLEALKKVFRLSKVFSILGEAVLRAFCEECKILFFRGDFTIYNEGDPSDYCYLLISGALLSVIRGISRADVKPGEFFGEMGALFDSPRTSTVRVKTDGALVAAMTPDMYIKVGLAAIHEDAAMGRLLHRVNDLRNIPLFHSYSRAELMNLSFVVHELSVLPRTIMYDVKTDLSDFQTLEDLKNQPIRPEKSFFIVRSGECDVFAGGLTEQHEDVKICTLPKMSIFGAFAVGLKVSKISASSKTMVELYSIRIEDALIRMSSEILRRCFQQRAHQDQYIASTLSEKSKQSSSVGGFLRGERALKELNKVLRGPDRYLRVHDGEKHYDEAKERSEMKQNSDIPRNTSPSIELPMGGRFQPSGESSQLPGKMAVSPMQATQTKCRSRGQAAFIVPCVKLKRNSQRKVNRKSDLDKAANTPASPEDTTADCNWLESMCYSESPVRVHHILEAELLQKLNGAWHVFQQMHYYRENIGLDEVVSVLKEAGLIRSKRDQNSTVHTTVTQDEVLTMFYRTQHAYENDKVLTIEKKADQKKSFQRFGISLEVLFQTLQSIATKLGIVFQFEESYAGPVMLPHFQATDGMVQDENYQYSNSKSVEPPRKMRSTSVNDVQNQYSTHDYFSSTISNGFGDNSRSKISSISPDSFSETAFNSSSKLWEQVAESNERNVAAFYSMVKKERTRSVHRNICKVNKLGYLPQNSHSFFRNLQAEVWGQPNFNHVEETDSLQRELIQMEKSGQLRFFIPSPGRSNGFSTIKFPVPIGGKTSSTLYASSEGASMGRSLRSANGRLSRP